jgi:hypothetical protein
MTDTIETQDEAVEELAGETVEEAPRVPFAHVGKTGVAMTEAVTGMLQTELNAATWHLTGLIRQHDAGDEAAQETFAGDLDDLLDYITGLRRTIDDLKAFRSIMPPVIEGRIQRMDALTASLDEFRDRLADELAAMGVKVPTPGWEGVGTE